MKNEKNMRIFDRNWVGKWRAGGAKASILCGFYMYFVMFTFFEKYRNVEEKLSKNDPKIDAKIAKGRLGAAKGAPGTH